MTGGWATYSWPPAIALTSVMLVFLMDFYAERYAEKKYNLYHTENVETIVTDQPGRGAGAADRDRALSLTHNQMHSGDQDENLHATIAGEWVIRQGGEEE
jgi:zinc transporter 1/2/3